MTLATHLRGASLGCLALAACADEPTEPPPTNRPAASAPVREWSFHELPADRSGRRPARAPQRQEGGVVDDAHDYGPLPLRVDGDDAATGHVFSSATGETYWVLAEGPASTLQDPSDAVGNVVELRQRQSFRKDAEDASLTFTVTGAQVRAINTQGPGILSEACRRDPDLCRLNLEADVAFEVIAHGPPHGLIFHGQSALQLWSSGTEWLVLAGQTTGSTRFWGSDDFTTSLPSSPNAAGEAVVRLRAPLTIPVDLSRVRVGDEFTLHIDATARTYNLLQGETYVSAYFRDPAGFDGSVVRIAGLTPTNAPLPRPDLSRAGEAPECTNGTGAGALQFGAPRFTTHELPVGGPREVTVVRVGGSAGHVSAVVRTSDGSAGAGADYRPVDRVVVWPPGDTAPRVVPVEAVLDTIAEPDETVTVTLSTPRGCATLGAASAVLTIVDDDRPVEAPPTFAVGGEVAGLVGGGLVLRNTETGEEVAAAGNGAFAFARRQLDGSDYDVRVAAQPTGPAQVCTVAGGTGTIAGADVASVRVSCTTTASASGLDPAFGSGGIVTTPIPGVRGEAVLVQPDGRIVVAGHGATSGSRDFVLVRYEPDGRLDATFGAGGIAAANLAGNRIDEAFDAARQPDGRIVVVGRTQRPAPTVGFDFGIVRFNADGTLDQGFGSGGSVVVPGSGGDYAQAVAIQPDGRIVVAGHASVEHANPLLSGSDFAVVRLNADGTLDASFGAGGRATTNVFGRTDFAYDVALQPDGKIVLAGVGDSTAGSDGDFALVRYHADGTLDEGFGERGIVTSAFGDGVSAEAQGVVVQPDGRIVAVGHVGVGSNSFNVALARYGADGTPDRTFGAGGTVVTDLSGRDDLGRGLALQPDGRIVVVGHRASNDPNADLAIARYLADGTLDRAFGREGAVTVDFFGAADAGQGVAIQPDGRIVGVGHARNGAALHLALVRVLP